MPEVEAPVVDDWTKSDFNERMEFSNFSAAISEASVLRTFDLIFCANESVNPPQRKPVEIMMAIFRKEGCFTANMATLLVIEVARKHLSFADMIG